MEGEQDRDFRFWPGVVSTLEGVGDFAGVAILRAGSCEGPPPNIILTVSAGDGAGMEGLVRCEGLAEADLIDLSFPLST